MPGDNTKDEKCIYNIDRFKIEAHNILLDKVVESIHKRFSTTNSDLCADFALLDPTNFEEVRNKEVPTQSL